MKKRLDEQVKFREELQSKQVSLLSQQKFGIEEISELQEKNAGICRRIDEVREKIK